MKPPHLVRKKSLKEKLIGSLVSGSSYSNVDLEEQGFERAAKNPIFDVGVIREEGELTPRSISLKHYTTKRKSGVVVDADKTALKRTTARSKGHVVENASLRVARVSQNLSHYSIHSDRSDNNSRTLPQSLVSQSGRTIPSLKFTNSRDDYLQQDVEEESLFNKELLEPNNGTSSTDFRRQLSSSRHIAIQEIGSETGGTTGRNCLSFLSCWRKKEVQQVS